MRKVQKRSFNPQDVVAVLCFFLSGFAALVYEVSWIRKASMVFGSSTFAVSTVLAVFFLGLACGSFLFGRIGQKASRPLRLFAMIEIGIGLIASVSPYGFDLMDGLFGAVYRATAQEPALLLLSRGILVALVILPPTILMGGSLPLFCRQYVVKDSRIAGSVGLLYGVNTLGAAVGCATTGFFLLPSFGLQNSVLVGAVLNVLCGIVVGSMRIAKEDAPDIPVKEEGSHSRSGIAIPLLFFSVGFAALGSEVLWTRYLGLLIHNSVYTYTLILTVVLVGIVIGSVVSSRFFDRRVARARYFGAFQVLSGIGILVLMKLPPGFWRGIGDELWVTFLLVLFPAVLSGASFPLAIRMVVGDASKATVNTGRMAGVNTMGGIFGSLFLGFVALPAFGMQTSLLFTTGLSLAIGFASWIWIDRSRRVVFWGPAVVTSLVIWLGIPPLTGVRIPADFLGERESLVAYREGVGSNLAVIRKEHVLQLEIEGWWQGEDQKNHQIMAAHIPMLLHPKPRRVLVVGVGTGQTASRFLMYPVDRFDCVDIEPTIFEFIRGHFESGWMNDERVALIREDGRNYLRHGKGMYDVISLEVGQIFRPGVAFFYTADFYHRARERLNPGGLVAQFVAIPFFTTEQLQGVLKTFLDAFPQSTLWYNTSELLLVGVNDGGDGFNQELLGRLSDDLIQEDLSYSHWGGPEYHLNSPHVFLAGYLMGPQGLSRLAAGGGLYRDDRPVLDYATNRVYESKGYEISNLKRLRAQLEPIETLGNFHLSPDGLLAIEKIREKNLSDIVVRALIRRVNQLIPYNDFAGIVSLLSRAVRLNPEHFLANRMMGDALLIQGRYEEALAYYLAAYDIRNEDGPVLHGLGVANQHLGRIDDAIESYRRALRVHPDHAETHNNLGVALGQDGDLAGALHHFEEAVRLRPGYADAEQNLAMARSYRKGGPTGN